MKLHNYLKTINSEIAIICRTEQEAKELITLLYSLGYRWGGGNYSANTTFWGKYDPMVYWINIESRISYSDLSYLQSNNDGVPMYEFQDLEFKPMLRNY